MKGHTPCLKRFSDPAALSLLVLLQVPRSRSCFALCCMGSPRSARSVSSLLFLGVSQRRQHRPNRFLWNRLCHVFSATPRSQKQATSRWAASIARVNARGLTAQSTPSQPIGKTAYALLHARQSTVFAANPPSQAFDWWALIRFRAHEIAQNRQFKTAKSPQKALRGPGFHEVPARP